MRASSFGRVTTATIVLLALCASRSTAATIHVPADQPTIQAGIDAATTGDTVLIACGTYDEYGISLKAGVVLRSETGQPDCVTIDAGGMWSVFTAWELSSEAVIEGFRITRGGGEADPIEDNYGGGLYCYDSPVRVLNCSFENNRARDGGAVFAAAGSDVSIEGCSFLENRTAPDWDSRGGAVHAQNAALEFRNCLFRGNYAAGDGGAIYALGSPITLEGCVITRNETIFWARGGGIFVEEGPADLVGCTIYGNIAGQGSAIVSSNFLMNVSRCIIASNTGGACVACVGGYQMSCCDIFGNEGGDWLPCISDQLGLNGNFSAEPLFCDAESGDLHLAVSSPCAPAQQPECGLIGALGVACGTTATQAVTWGAVKELFRR